MQSANAEAAMLSPLRTAPFPRGQVLRERERGRHIASSAYYAAASAVKEEIRFAGSRGCTAETRSAWSLSKGPDQGATGKCGAGGLLPRR